MLAKNILWQSAALLALALLWALVIAKPADAAITDRFPDADSVSQANGNSNAYAGVAQSGYFIDEAGQPYRIGRDTPTSEFKAFYKLNGPGSTTNATFQVTLLRACDFSRPIYLRGNPDMNVSIHRIDTTTGVFGAMVSQQANTNPSNCNGVDMNFTINRADVQLVPGLYGSEYGVVGIRATKLPGAGANSFQVLSTDGQGLISFNEQTAPDTASTSSSVPAATSFAIWDNPNWTRPREYNFEFKPDCNFAASYSDVHLRWLDADMDEIDRDISFTIEMFDEGNATPVYTRTIDRNTTPDIGDTGPSSYRYIRVPVASNTQYYRWTWRNVTGLNGLQLWMPFSEMNRFIACPPAPSQIVCTAQVVGTPYPGGSFSVIFTMYNNSSTTISSADQYDMGANHPSTGSSTDNYMAPDPSRWVRDPVQFPGGAVSPSSSTQWTQTFRAYQPSASPGEKTGPDPGSYSGTVLAPGTHQFQWRLIQNDTTWSGAMCPATLTVIPVPNAVTCTIITNPVNPSVGQQIRITATLQNNPASAGSLDNANSDMTISASGGVLPPTLVDFDGDAVTPGNQPVPPGGSGSGGADATVSGAGTFTASATVTSPFGAPATCTNNVQVSAKPYVKFFGADVNAGGSFNDDTTPCAVAGGFNGSGIKAFARNDRAPQTYHGSSVEFAAFSLALIEGDSAATPNDQERGFYSASLRNSGREGLYLTFANVSNSYVSPADRWNATYWGGEFAVAPAAPRCIEDYFTTTRISTVTPLAGADLFLDGNGGGNGLNDTGQYSTNGPVVLRKNDPGSLFSRRVTLYVDGDIFIDENIAYNTNFVSGIPYLSIVAKGNIYIGNNVTNIDALLVAQPRDNTGVTGGRVYTCATRNGINFSLFDDSQLASQCSQKLTIHGSVVAQQIRFLRTRGSLSSATAPEFSGSGTIAEVIDMTPEFYVGVPMFKPRSGSNTGAQTYHAIQALPPVF